MDIFAPEKPRNRIVELLKPREVHVPSWLYPFTLFSIVVLLVATLYINVQMLATMERFVAVVSMATRPPAPPERPAEKGDEWQPR